MSKVKVVLLTAISTLAAFGLGGCLGEDLMKKAIQYVTIGNIFN